MVSNLSVVPIRLIVVVEHLFSEGVGLGVQGLGIQIRMQGLVKRPSKNSENLFCVFVSDLVVGSSIKAKPHIPLPAQHTHAHTQVLNDTIDL